MRVILISALLATMSFAVSAEAMNLSESRAPEAVYYANAYADPRL